MALVTVIGTTSWGTTLAILLAKRDINVCLWARSEQEALDLQRTRENRRFLPGFPFPPRLSATASISKAMHKTDMIVYAVPSARLRENLRVTSDAIPSHSVVLSVCKGLERESGKRMSEVLTEELPQKIHSYISLLSGPNLAMEIASGKPASAVIAAAKEDVAMRGRDLFMSPAFRIYTNTDMIGVELGGALKNVIAIGAGMSDGLGYGDNAKAAFVTRGLVEITRLGVAAGANATTFSGLAGLGDLMATCSSSMSRNRYVGEQLALGRSLREILASMRNVAEGIDTTVATLRIASQLHVEMPITEATYRVLFDGLKPSEAVMELMGRSPRSEWSATS